MKARLFLLFFLMLGSFSFGQGWQWALQIGGTNDDGGSICLDENNNSYVFGNFYSNCYFPNDTFYSNGVNDFFLAKYDGNGQMLWAKHFGGYNTSGHNEYAAWDAINPYDNYLYISGSFYGTLTIDTCSVTSYGGSDVFLTKLDLNGNCIWLKKAGSAGDDEAGAFQFDASANILFTGTVYSTAQFGSISIAAGGYLAKYDTSGNCLWAFQKFKNAYFSCMKYLGNDIIMTGTTKQDTAIIDTSTLVSNNHTDALLARFDSSGNVKWVKRNGGIFDDYGSYFDFDSQGNIYNSGYFKDSANFNGVSLTNGNRYDLYLAKFNSNNGNLIWINQSHAAGGINYGARAAMVSTDSIGNTYQVGSFGGTASFGNFSVTANYYDMFIARYDSGGNCLGLRNFGTARGYGLGVTSNGSVIVSGVIEDTATVGNTILISHGGSDIFVAKCDAITEVQERQNLNNKLIIYANPNNGTFNIKVPEDIKGLQGAVLVVYDYASKETARFRLDNKSDRPHFDVINAANGMYLVKLIKGDKTYTGKLVVE
jgi:hypothetical protein